MTVDIVGGLRRGVTNDRSALHHRLRMDENVRTLLDHLEEWRGRHPNSWIAVYDGQLMAVESSKERLFRALDHKKIPLAEVLLDFLNAEKSILVL